MKEVLWRIILIGFIWLVAILFNEISKQKKPSATQPTSEAQYTENIVETDAKWVVDRETQIRLMAMVGGDRYTADRLLTSVRSVNPSMPEQWIWEKVIWDLERDRRY